MNEDTTTADDTTTDTGEATDADLIAAAQEVGGTEAVLEAEATPPAKADTPKPADAVTDEPKIAAVLRAREKAFAERQDADDYAAQRRAAADREAAAMLADARARAEKEHADFIESKKREFRDNPTEHLRSLSSNPQDIVDAVIREGTPEARAMRELQEQIASARAEAAKAGKVSEEFSAWKEQQAQAAHQYRVAAVKQTFLSTHAAPEQTPYLNKRYDADEIFDKANALAVKWQAANIPFDHGDVAQYLEFEARKRILGDASAGAPPQQVGGASGTASKVKATGSRTLSASDGSERRASPKPIEEMSPDEERNALIEAVREARRTGSS